MANPQEIIAAIVACARVAPEVMGAHLGIAVKRAVPDSDIKQYGGLRRFIQAYCGETIHWVRKHGLDDVYRINPSALPTGHSRTIPAVGAWRAFTGPTNPYAVYVNPKDGSLTVLPEQAEAASGFVLLPKMSAEEHRGIAQRFLTRINPDHRGKFEEVLKQVQFWPGWAMQTRTFADGMYKNDWLTFRTEQILGLLQTKLTELGLAGPTRESVLQRIRESKEIFVTPGHAPPSGFHAGHARGFAAPDRRGYRETEIKRLAHQAIDLLGENEIRKLRFPLGVVINAIRSRQL